MKTNMLSILFWTGIICAIPACNDIREDITKSENDGSVKVSIFTNEVIKTTSPNMTGFNMSYYHDKDHLWENREIAQRLKEVNSRVLRYPGGAETGYFHWKYPGVPGYKDIWNPNHIVGDYENVTENMDTDEFIEWCRVIGAEPLLGINILSGVRNNRLGDSLEEAKEWVQYCKDKGYNVKYWYLDNEVDHSGSYTQITVNKYAEIINLFTPALKAIDPDIKIIVSIIGNATSSKYENLINLAGSNFDMIDLHCYYDWNNAEWKKWIGQKPMINYETKMTYDKEVKSLAEKIKTGEHPHIKLSTLEWNIAPSKVDALSDYQQVLMQTEMFQQLVAAPLEMACMWPLIWNVGQGRFPSLLYQNTYQPAPLYSIFKLYGEALGHKLINNLSSDLRIVSQSILSNDGNRAWVFAINKSDYPIKLKTAFSSADGFNRAKANIVYSNDITLNTCETQVVELTVLDNTATVEVPPFSFTCVELSK